MRAERVPVRPSAVWSHVWLPAVSHPSYPASTRASAISCGVLKLSVRGTVRAVLSGETGVSMWQIDVSASVMRSRTSSNIGVKS